MIELRFTRKAESDILAIHAYTKDGFGDGQWTVYEDGLRTAFQTLRANPMLGADRSGVKAGVRRLIFQSHVIYYRVDPNRIVVLRILGVRQDPGRHL